MLTKILEKQCEVLIFKTSYNSHSNNKITSFPSQLQNQTICLRFRNYKNKNKWMVMIIFLLSEGEAMIPCPNMVWIYQGQIFYIWKKWCMNTIRYIVDFEVSVYCRYQARGEDGTLCIIIMMIIMMGCGAKSVWTWRKMAVKLVGCMWKHCTRALLFQPFSLALTFPGPGITH